MLKICGGGVLSTLIVLLFLRCFNFTEEPRNDWNLQLIFWVISQCILRRLSKMESPLILSSVISLSVWCVRLCLCMVCLLAPALFEEPSLAAPNQQIYDLYKWILQNQRHCRKWFLNIGELSIQSNKDSCCEHIAGGVNIYIYLDMQPEKEQGGGGGGGVRHYMGSLNRINELGLLCQLWLY